MTAPGVSMAGGDDRELVSAARWGMANDGFDPDAVAASYDAMAPQYVELFGDDLARNANDRRFLDTFIGALPGAGLACDAGCGPGHVAAYLTSQGRDAIGVDLSPGMVDLARSAHPEVSFEVGDMRNLGRGGPRFAGVVAFYSLIHLPRRELPGALLSIKEALVPAGVLGAIIHEGEGEVHVEEWRGEAVHMSASYFTVDELRAVVEASGFEVELLRTRPPYAWEHPRDKVQLLARLL